uniref:Uncharacterized protein n=1 Tax=Cucumis melo TaxID=3656 RepID=A0A9I9EDK8_CUCME
MILGHRYLPPKCRIVVEMPHICNTVEINFLVTSVKSSSTRRQELKRNCFVPVLTTCLLGEYELCSLLRSDDTNILLCR